MPIASGILPSHVAYNSHGAVTTTSSHLEPPPVSNDDDDASIWGDDDATNASISSNTDDDADEDLAYSRQTEPTSGGHLRHQDLQNFAKAWKDFDTTLEKFSNYVQKVGSAILLLKASRSLQDTTHDLLDLLRHHIGSPIRREASFHSHQSLSTLEGKSSIPPRLAKYLQQHCPDAWAAAKDKRLALKRLCLSKSLGLVAAALETFDNAVEDFPEFTNEDGRRNLLSFQSIVQSWSNAIEVTSKGDDRQEYRDLVNRMILQLSEDIERMNHTLKMFVEIGIPCIIASQKRSFALLLNIATVATFLSAVTASTLQYSFNLNGETKTVIVNACWFSSLVLSIAAATNSLLTLAWRQAVYSTPRTRVPWWILIWFRQSCLALLIASVVTFVAGLLIFVVDTQHVVVIWIVIGVSAFCTVGLGFVTIWFAWERLDYRKLRDDHRKQRFQRDHTDRKTYFQLMQHYVLASWGRLRDLPRKVTPQQTEYIEKHHVEAFLQALPSSGGATTQNTSRWRAAGRKVMRVNTAQKAEKRLEAAKLIWDSDIPTLFVDSELDLHQSVIHMQFSPSGSFLAVCVKKCCHIFKVGDGLTLCDTLTHKTGKPKQAEWSPDGRRLLTRTRHGFKCWIRHSEDTWRVEKRIKCRATPQHVKWINNEDFITISNESMFKMAVKRGEVEEFTLRTMRSTLRESHLTRFTFEKILLIKSSTQVLLLVNQRHPHRASLSDETPWKHIIAFDLFSRKHSHLKMSFDGMMDLDASHDGKHIVFGYSDKSPDIWSLDLSGEKITEPRACELEVGTSSLSFSLGDIQLAGPYQLYVASADEHGVVHIWQRESGLKVGTLPPPENWQRPGRPLLAWTKTPNEGRPLIARADGNTGRLQLLRPRRSNHHDPGSHTATAESRSSSPPRTERKPGLLERARRKVRKETHDSVNDPKNSGHSTNALRTKTSPLLRNNSYRIVEETTSEKDLPSELNGNEPNHPTPSGEGIATSVAPLADRDLATHDVGRPSDQDSNPRHSTSSLRSWCSRSWKSAVNDSIRVASPAPLTPPRSETAASIDIAVEPPSPTIEDFTTFL